MQVTQQTFTSWDGAQLFYRAWLPDRPATRAILLFHRGHEHSARWQETVDAFHLSDTAFFAWDQRGHGQSPGPRGGAANVAALIKDADCFARHVAAAHAIPLEEMGVVASSLGAVVAAAWIHDFAPPIRAMVLAAPALRIKLYVPFAIPFLRLKELFLPGGVVTSFVKAGMLTHDPHQAAAYDADPLIFRRIPINVLLDLYDTATRLLGDAAAIRTPTLILTAGNDWVVRPGAQRRFLERLGSTVKQMEVFPRLSHSLFHETARDAVVDRCRVFLEECFSAAPPDDALLRADKGGFTRTEYDLLRTPPSLRWRLMRTMLKIGSWFSAGIRLGRQTGFDSGLTLDYVYENKPRGLTPIGRIVDWFYLNAIGWRGIRIRRQNIEKVLAAAIERIHGSGRGVHILDIASGPGRYVLETLARLPNIPASALLRDYKQLNLDAAARLAAQLQLTHVTVQRGDAFDRASLAGITRATIAVSSGIYELFPDNAPVLASLRGIADAMGEGGFLIYTCQPWHPQVEFIARVLTNREGEPWVMRRRSQAEMDTLVRNAGFEKVEQQIDPWGIFSVSLARRVA